ncbi:MAG: thioesterase family protein [Geodermatophilaceae bacterium]
MSSPPALMAVGLQARRVFEVVELDTARALGSGSVPVLGTPRLLAWMEEVTVAALGPALRDSDTSVGSAVELAHLRPSAVGARVSIQASVASVEGAQVVLDVQATHGDGTTIGRGRITRTVVDREAFLDRVGPVNPG